VAHEGVRENALCTRNASTYSFTFTLPSGTDSIQLYTRAFNSTGGSTASSPIRIYAIRSEIDALHYAAWVNLNAALSSGNKELAKTFLTPAAQVAYDSIFDEIVKNPSRFAEGYLPGISLLSKSASEAQYLVVRYEEYKRRVFAIQLVKMEDGSWKIESM
jgi:hypothetical protein